MHLMMQRVRRGRNGEHVGGLDHRVRMRVAPVRMRVTTTTHPSRAEPVHRGVLGAPARPSAGPGLPRGGGGRVGGQDVVVVVHRESGKVMQRYDKSWSMLLDCLTIARLENNVHVAVFQLLIF